jgi:LmbE family N-acetylglucosaminyl deacetylase
LKILAIGSHPDDIEYGCGGTLLKAAQNGHEIHMLVMTCGRVGGNVDVRKKEQEESAKKLGATLHWGEFEDTKLVYGQELINRIESCVNEVQPNSVFVNSPEDSHQDHRALALSTAAACRYIKNVLYYHDYTSLRFIGSVFVDIHDFVEAKVDLLSTHRSQIKKPNPAELDMCESVRSLASYYGFTAKVKYAEAFNPLRTHLEL